MLQPLLLDAANPSPNQGWNEHERKGLKERANADAVLALAFVHHLAIGRNIPLADVVEWLVGLAPQGVIEFVPKADPKVQELLALREDIFPQYSEENFRRYLSSRASIIEVATVTESPLPAVPGETKEYHSPHVRDKYAKKYPGSDDLNPYLPQHLPP